MVFASISGWSFRASFVLSWLAVGVVVCAGQGDVDRTQPDAIDKAIFFEADGATLRKFYYRKTTVAVPPTSSYSFDGLMGDMYKVRFSKKMRARTTSLYFIPRS